MTLRGAYLSQTLLVKGAEVKKTEPSRRAWRQDWSGRIPQLGAFAKGAGVLYYGWAETP